MARHGGDQGPWAGNAWGHYVLKHWGETPGEVNDFSHAFYKSLTRQVLRRGTILPDGSVLEKSCYAIDQLPRKRKKRGHSAV